MSNGIALSGAAEDFDADLRVAATAKASHERITLRARLAIDRVCGVQIR